MKRLIIFTIALLAAFCASAQKRYLVVPVEFSDISFTNLDDALGAKTKTASAYFSDQFGTAFKFDIAPTVRLYHEQAWYGENSTTLKDERIGVAVREVCQVLGLNPALYDSDSDNTIDNLCIVTAGGSEALGDGAKAIWPQQAYLHDRGGTASWGGRTVDSFTVCTEFSSARVFCHEICHSFGLQDLYDTDGSGSGGTAPGVWGGLSLMGSGNEHEENPTNFCAVELEQLGLGIQKPMRTGYQILRPIGSIKEYMRIDSDNENEYFLLECRQREAWDSSLGGEGLVVYHIDRSANNSWYSDLYGRSLSAGERWRLNQVNCRPDHQCAMVKAAMPALSSPSAPFFPQAGHDSFSSETDPAFRYWNGNSSEIAIDNIVLENDGSVSFNLIFPVQMGMVQVFQDSAILNWNTDSSLDTQECVLTWYPEGQKTEEKTRTEKSLRKENGAFSHVLEGLEPSTTYTVIISVVRDNGAKLSRAVSFSTKSRQSRAYPFIYLSFVSRNSDGSFPPSASFPLRVYNLQDARYVEWMFNDKYIYPEADGYWHTEASGMLKAVIWYTDGSKEIITKKLIVR